MKLHLGAYAICIAAVLAGTATGADPFAAKPPMTTIADVDDTLRKLITDTHPDATITVTDDQFVAKVNTMSFIVHSVHRGVISECFHETEGPRHNGFIVSVRYSTSAYGGPAMVPRTFREPYWTSLINEMYNVQQNSHLWFSYQYGSQIDKTLHKRVMAIVGDGRYSSQMPGRSPRRTDPSPLLLIPTTKQIPCSIESTVDEPYDEPETSKDSWMMVGRPLGPGYRGRYPTERYQLMPFPVDAKWIAVAEEKIGARLPASYVTAMTKMNGGSVVSSTGTWSLFHIFDGSDRKRIQRTCSSIDRETANARDTRYEFPADVVVIGENGCGDLLVLRHMPDARENLQHDVYWWDHETGEINHLVDDFSDLPKIA